ncbi:MAG: sigma-54 dependent transcriptional regulator [Syntrophobacteraceae bacterium]|nr:sigma-54 dependent transcriptional regulator [Syntrophobacteraceae bacterium]
MAGPRILIVDDEQIARENLEHVLKREGYQTVSAADGLVAIKELEKEEFDVVLTDIRMQPVDGFQVLERARDLYPGIEVIVITGYASISSAVQAMQKGAYYYIPKPYKIDEVRILVKQAVEKRGLRREVMELRQQVRDQNKTSLLIGKSAEMENLRKMVEQVAVSDSSVLILGETGTGKELVARTLHNSSPRAQKRFLAINCGAFSEELLANELFGHEREAFTGAKNIKRGLLEAAQGGTVFLDEIGEMPLFMQVKLLRALQERVTMRVGGIQEIPIDIRIVAATNRNLKKEIECGTFRQDFYYRLNVITLQVPRLADRKDDIVLLSLHFLQKLANLQGKPAAKISDRAVEILLSYEYPGNVRELENIIERAVTLSNGLNIDLSHLPLDLQQLALRVQPRPREFLTLDENERNYILWVLKQVEDNKTKAAEILGIDRVSLWRKIKRYEL